MVVILIFLLAVEVINHIKYKISTQALVYYMETKKYTLPTKREMKECTDYCVKKIKIH